jgi:hypothetical protein
MPPFSLRLFLFCGVILSAFLPTYWGILKNNFKKHKKIPDSATLLF